MYTSRDTVVLRMLFRCVGAKPAWDQGGIIVLWMRGAHGSPGLLVVVDEGEGNDGASATNVMDGVLSAAKDALGAMLNEGTCNVVQIDSTGSFDHVWPVWDRGVCRSVKWTPIGWPGQAARSEAAMRGAFGAQGIRALAIIRAALGR